MATFFWSRKSSLDDDVHEDNTLQRVYQLSMEQKVEDEEFLQMLESIVLHEDDDEDDVEHAPKPVKKRSKKAPILEYFDKEGNIVPVPPSESPWYRLYVLADPSKWKQKHHIKFRRRFRMPYPTFKDLVSRVKQETTIFRRWLGTTTQWEVMSDP